MANSKEIKKTTIEEALIDFKELLNEADKSAREKIIKSMPDKFNKLLTEEINKITNKKSEKEPVVEGEKKEFVSNKKSDNKNLNEDIDLTNEGIGAVEDVYDNANPDDEFTVENDEFDFSELEKELAGLDGTGDETIEVDDQTDVIPDLAGESTMKETDQVTDPYQKFKMLYEKMGEIVTDMENKEKEKMFETEFNSHIANMFGENHNLSEEVFNSIYEEFKSRKMSDPFEDKSLNEDDESDPYDEVSKKNIAETNNDESDPYGEKKGDAPNVSEMKNAGGLSGPKQNKSNANGAGGPNQATINEKNEEDEDADIEAIDEIHGQSYAAGKVRAGTLPNDGQQYRNRGGKNSAQTRTRPEWGGVSESLTKKVKILLEDKKKLSKKVNEQRDQLGKLEKINEQYKEGLTKYRTHLQEMAVFNTNLSHVNNILVESVDDKTSVKEIINKFKGIVNIEESKNLYNSVITEMKSTNKEVIKEEIEDKLNKEVIGESSSVNGDKSKVLTESAYKNDAHLTKLNRLINYKLGK